jgi:hypothetical protein
MNKTILEEDLVSGNVIIHGIRQLDGIALLGSPIDNKLNVRFIDGTPDGLKEITKWLKLQSKELNLRGIEGFTPVTHLIINTLKNEGFDVREERQLLVYALKLRKE